MSQPDNELSVPSTPSRINVSELRRCAEYTAQCFISLANSLRPEGELAVTGRRMSELGTSLHMFGVLYERYFTQDDATYEEHGR